MNSRHHANFSLMTLAIALAASGAAFAQPNATNTGPTNTSVLKPLSETNIRTNGAVIENFTATSQVTIDASNVTLRNFKINTSDNYAIRVTGGSNIIIEDGELTGMRESGIMGSGFTMRRMHIHNAGADAIKVDNDAIIEDSYIHSLGSASGSHADGVQMTQGKNIIVRRNNFDMPHDEPGYNNSQVFMIKTDFNKIDNLTIEDNWINGGGYSVQVRQTSTYGAPTNVHIRNNRFGTEYQYGPWLVDGSPEMCANVWEASGSLLSGQSANTCSGGSSARPATPALTSVQ